ncbi:MAG TPA: extracellular solute-binding protein, partial [Chloroflexota bacterium]|nr:extracellular solute-binding protein [Chloroflexota bacterium]
GGAGILAPLLLACGGAGQPSGAGTSPAGRKAPVTLQIWENPRFRWREGVGKAITDPLLEANPWLTLDAQVPAGVAQEKFLAASAAGTAPDTYSQGSLGAQQDFVDGVTISLEKYLATSKAIKKADLWESLRRDMEFKGHLVSIPYAPDTRILYTHEENARKAGLDPQRPPAKWSELEAGAFKAFKGTPASVEHLGWYPFMGSGGNYLWMVPYWQLGGELLNADQTKVTLFNDRAIEALTWLKKIVDNQGGWLAVDAFRKSFSAASGETVFMENGATYLHATLSERGEQFKVKAPAMRFTVSSYPLPDKGGTVANYGGCHTLPIAKGSKYPEVMWQFIEWVTNTENNTKFAVENDRVPIRESSTNSQAYIQGDQPRALQAQEMKKRRFVISVAGGAEKLPHQDVVAPFMSGQMSLQDTLQEKERLLQEILDRYLQKARTLNP